MTPKNIKSNILNKNSTKNKCKIVNEGKLKL